MMSRFRIVYRTVLCGAACLIASAFLPVPAEAQSDTVYLTELSLRAGYHRFSGSNSWNGSWKRTLAEDLFFRDENFNPDNNHVYYSENVDASVSDPAGGFPVITLEYSMGFWIDRIPFIDPPDTRREIQGARLGISLSYYPYSSTRESHYRGPIIYHNSKALPPDPENIEYSGVITLRENLFILVPAISLSYFYEEGLRVTDGDLKLMPFVGMELGVATVSGMRKTSLRSDSLYVAATGETRRIEADIQEGFFNGISPRMGIFAGCRITSGSLNSLDLRIGFVYQETEVTMTRSGSWSETIDGAAYSRRVHEESRSAVYSQTGLIMTVGYSLRLK